MADPRRPKLRPLALCAVVVTLAACSDGLDLDLRGVAGGLDTTDASRQATEPRPRPDARGIISYPSFDVAVARRGDTVASVASRIGIDAGALARHNGLQTETRLRPGEVIALPNRIAEQPAESDTNADVDIATLAGNALDRVPEDQAPLAPPPPVQSGPEPVQHQVVRGETAYSIARLYDVSVRALSDWNGLGPDLNVREGQFLLIPIALAEAQPEPVALAEEEPEIESVPLPGAGSAAPEPPSASTPLPDPEDEPVAAEVPAPPANLAEERTEASASRLILPVDGAIIRDYEKGVNDGVGIAASAGTPVKAAGDGQVAAITRDVDGVPILVLRHPGNLLTVYANIENVAFEKDQQVRQGDVIAEVRSTSPSFLHFEVREGIDSVDPIDFVN